MHELEDTRATVERETAYRRNGAKGLIQKRLDDLPEAVADLIRKEMKTNGEEYAAAARVVYSRALSIYLKKHPEIEGLTEAKQAVADRLKVSLSTIKRYTGKAV
ncbi:MAG: hypothetical protein ISS31_04440 [Kiritimatiellae bacterium]|nr:hypothetical protein [Kiritimatiellia bacterium]